jgi:hypothetical protein
MNNVNIKKENEKEIIRNDVFKFKCRSKQHNNKTAAVSLQAKIWCSNSFLNFRSAMFRNDKLK